MSLPTPDLLRKARIKYAEALREKEVREARRLQSNPEGGLLEFIRYFWHVLEPVDPFVEGWPLECLCAHLEAITRGDTIEVPDGVERTFNRLLANVPPGFQKSLCVNVWWPSWEWGPMALPHLRYVAFSYASDLTERDNAKFRDLICSQEYRELWGHVFNVVGDGKIRVTNDKTGFKFASSLLGVGTGERGHRVLCLPGTERILTDQGWLPIGHVVEGRLPVKVGGVDHAIDAFRWQAIEAYERNPGNEIIEIACEGGALRCTRDHPVFVQGRGYARADSVKEGDTLVWSGSAFQLPILQRRNPSQAKSCAQILQSHLPGRWRAGVLASLEQPTVRSLPNSRVSASITSQANARATVLQSQMPWPVEQRQEQSVLCRRPPHASMRMVQETAYQEANRRPASRMLLAKLRNSIEMGARRLWEAIAPGKALQVLQARFSTAFPWHELLLNVLQGRSARLAGARKGERSLRSWVSSQQISQGVEQELQSHNPLAGWECLSTMWAWATANAELRRTSRRLRQGQSSPKQFDHALPFRSWQDAWEQEVPRSMGTAIVRSVNSVGWEDVVYNVRVGPHHNYFANGILVHNCDDLNKIKGSAESDESRLSVATWALEAMQNRLNDLQRDAIVCIQQRTHERDVSGALSQDLGNEYCHLIVPMEYEDGRHFSHYKGWNNGDDPRERDGELAWPERFPLSVLTSYRANTYLWAGQYQQRPAPRGGGLIKEDWWQIHEVSPKFAVQSIGGRQTNVITGYKFKPEFVPLFVLASLDTAFSEKEENDYSALTVWAVHDHPQTKHRAILLVDAWQKRLPHLHGEIVERLPDESAGSYRRRAKEKWGLVEWVAETCKLRKVDRLVIENKNRGPDVVKEIKRLYADQDWSVQALDVRGDKWSRGHAIVDLFTDGMIYAPAEIKENGAVWYLEWAKTAIEEISGFPRSAHDDLFDSMTLALQNLRTTGWAIRKDEKRASDIAKATFKGNKRPALYDV